MFRASKSVIRLGWLAMSAVLVLAALASVATAVQTVLASRTLPDARPVSTPPPALPADPNRTTYAGLSTSPVFGTLTPRTDVMAAPPEPVMEDLPVTTLKLRLVGVIAGDKANAMAVIENQKARVQNTYAIGDPIVEGAILDAIFEQRVVLVRNGRREVLEMHLEAVAIPASANSGTRVQASTASGRRRAPQLRAGARTSQTGAIRRINDNLRVINREEFEREIGGDLIQSVTSVRTEPRMVGGAPSGVTMSDLGRGDTLAQLGFQAGDVVVSVNGQRVNSEQDLALLAESLRSASDVRVQVIRGNLPRTLIFKVR